MSLRGAKQTGIAASVKTISSCTRTDVCVFLSIATFDTSYRRSQPGFACVGKSFTLSTYLQMFRQDNPLIHASAPLYTKGTSTESGTHSRFTQQVID